MRLRHIGAAATALAITAALVVAPAMGAAASEPFVFRGTASAEGVRVGVVASGAPLTNHVVDTASPIAQAAVDSTAGSSALASIAYPGDFIVTAPGLVAGFSGGRTSGSIPPYPLVVIAGSDTVPKSHAEAPGSTMQAAADDGSAEGSATTSGGTGATFSASAKVTASAAGIVDANATSTAEGATIGPVVVGNITARSAASRSTGRPVTRTSSFAAAGITIAGVGVSLTSDGLVLAGTTTPLDASPLTAVLAAAGVSVTFVRAEPTEDGIVSAGLIITRSQDLPAVITPATVTYTFGRAAAAASVATLSAIGGLDLSPVAESNTPGPVDGPSLTAALGLPSLAASGLTTDAAGLTAARPTRRAGQPTARGLFDLTTVYVVLVMAAGVAGIILELLRHLGVRFLWN
ncbi:MAG: hypothetical protein H0W70_01405 [Actinobacteria bacterium]|nr:hypothetical protein [Actinomycetota bacterium]